MMEGRNFKAIVAVLLALAMMMVMAACGNKAEEKPEEEPKQQEEQKSDSPELTDDQIDALMWQIADQEVERQYVKYIPDEGFANAEIFGIDRDGDEGTAYVNIFLGEYGVIDETAYNVSASAGEAIIKFTYTDDQPKFKELIWSADGGDHDKWLEENFPEEYLKKAKEYQAKDQEDNINDLSIAQAKDVEKEMGVIVDAENMLSVNLDDESYVILGMVEKDGEWTTEVKQTGKLADQKN